MRRQGRYPIRFNSSGLIEVPKGPNDWTPTDAYSGTCFEIGGPDYTSIDCFPSDCCTSQALPTPQSLLQDGLYEPLQDGETRLLRLWPAASQHSSQACGQAGVSAELVVAAIIHPEGATINCDGELVHYDAISYTWGAVETMHATICNNTRLLITHNLAMALEQLQHPTQFRYLWVDAVCIDQYDDTEKSHQVANMLSIYESAAQVIVWLGAADADSVLNNSHLE